MNRRPLFAARFFAHIPQHMKPRHLIPVVTALILAGPLATQADTVISSGHVDIGIGYKNGAFDLHVHVEEPVEAEYEPGEALLSIGPASQATAPGGAYSFLGTAGNPVWILPSTEVEGLPFLGFGTEELTPADWSGNLTLTLKSVTGPGSFSLWSVNSFGTPQLFMSSHDGIGSGEALSLTPGSHGHYNLGFTQPGTYGITFEAAGTHATDGPRVSGPVEYRFEVVPEPHEYALLAVGLAAIVWARRRR